LVTHRLHREDFVLKRSFVDKHTFAGIATGGRLWNRMLERALAEGGYLLQGYRPMSQATVPVLLDERIEWLPVRFEVSPFIIDGAFAGAMVRYGPDVDGVVLSPPPDGMGFGLVYAC